MNTPLPSMDSPARVRALDWEKYGTAAASVPVLDIEATVASLGRRACNFKEASDVDFGDFGDFKRAQFIAGGVQVLLQVFRTTEGTMTVYVDLAACLQRAVPPLQIAKVALEGLGLSRLRWTWVHTLSQQRYWEQVDPHLVAKVAARTGITDTP